MKLVAISTGALAKGGSVSYSVAVTAENPDEAFVLGVFAGALDSGLGPLAALHILADTAQTLGVVLPVIPVT